MDYKKKYLKYKSKYLDLKLIGGYNNIEFVNVDKLYSHIQKVAYPDKVIYTRIDDANELLKIQISVYFSKDIQKFISEYNKSLQFQITKDLLLPDTSNRSAQGEYINLKDTYVDVKFNEPNITRHIQMITLVLNTNGNFYDLDETIKNKITRWDTSNVTDMKEIFKNKNDFNIELKWDTSNVTDMSYMFKYCTKFNNGGDLYYLQLSDKPITFDTSNVTDMSRMFSNCTKFNQPINFSNTGNVTNMTGMFEYCTKFNQPITFNTEKVTEMSRMFAYCTKFNQPITFDTSNVNRMLYMLANCYDFNQTIKFNIKELKNYRFMFSQCYKLEVANVKTFYDLMIKQFNEFATTKYPKLGELFDEVDDLSVDDPSVDDPSVDDPSVDDQSVDLG